MRLKPTKIKCFKSKALGWCLNVLGRQNLYLETNGYKLQEIFVCCLQPSSARQ